MLDPVDQAYVDVPCARLERPSITLFEHRQAVAQIKADGLARVDEETIFRAITEQREIAGSLFSGGLRMTRKEGDNWPVQTAARVADAACAPQS